MRAKVCDASAPRTIRSVERFTEPDGERKVGPAGQWISPTAATSFGSQIGSSAQGAHHLLKCYQLTILCYPRCAHGPSACPSCSRAQRYPV